METDELEKYLEAGTESQRIDFKDSCPWDAEKYAKDILAMSNVQDGGVIIIGVKEEDQEFSRQGITEEHKITYIIDIMKDQIASFADPHVDFDFVLVKDKEQKEYGVIMVHPFLEVPAICRKDSRETQAGILYYRNRNGRPQSAKISNSYDMRDILSRAAVKLMQQYKAYELKVENSGEDQLKTELGNL